MDASRTEIACRQAPGSVLSRYSIAVRRWECFVTFPFTHVSNVFRSKHSEDLVTKGTAGRRQGRRSGRHPQQTRALLIVLIPAGDFIHSG